MGKNGQTAVHLIPLCDGEGMKMRNGMVPKKKNNPFAIPCFHALLMHPVDSTVLSGENGQSGILRNHPISYTLHLMPITYHCIEGRNGQSGIVSHLLYLIATARYIPLCYGSRTARIYTCIIVRHLIVKVNQIKK